MVIETRNLPVTVRVPYPATPDNVALTNAEPSAWLSAKPEAGNVITLALEEAQTAEAVMSLLDPSL
jgi:hypothetical protein